MVDGQSHYEVASRLAQYGAIVVPTPRPGLATPYLDAAQLVQVHAGPDAAVLKAEADKLLDEVSLAAIVRLLSNCQQVLVGDRTPESMESMTPIQHRTEALIDALIAMILGIPHGTSSGVQAYHGRGLQVFLSYEAELENGLGNNWKYLIRTPYFARQIGLNVNQVPVNVTYDPEMVAAENTPTMTLKRLEQLLLMLEGALELESRKSLDKQQYRPLSAERMGLAEQMLAMLRQQVAA